MDLARHKLIIHLCIILFVLLTALSDNGETAVAQSQLRWASQDRIPFYDDLILEPPQLIADSSGVVHAFNAQVTDSGAAIMYRHWTVDKGWTIPTDVIIPPNNEIQARNIPLDVSLDENGMVHLVFMAGNLRESNIYYSRAPLVDANNARAWSTPLIIGTHALLNPPQVTMIGDHKGDLFVAFSGSRDGSGLYMVQSNDGGNRWSEVQSIFLTYTWDFWPSALTMHIDSQENVHALWAVAGLDGLSDAVFYSRLEKGQTEWSEPFEMARVIGFQADTPAIIEYDKELFVTYHNDFPTTSWMRRSSDGGNTWTEPVRFAPGFVGSNGAIDFVIDSSNTLHAFWGNRTGSPIIHGMWHRVWLGDRWGDIEAVVSGPQVVDDIGGNGFDPKFARAVISRGNILLITWTTDGFAGENGAWYSYTILDAPQLPAEPVPAPIETPTPTAVPVTIDQTPTPNPYLAIGGNSEGGAVEVSPSTPLVAGIAPVLLLLGLIIVIYRLFFITRS